MSAGSDAQREESFSLRLSERVDALPPHADALRVIGLLRADFPLDVARWGATLHELRLRARRLYPADPPLWMTRRGWEQATAPPVAARRARLIRSLEPRVCHDATCGIGIDARALAREHSFTVASDRDPWMASCARAHLRDAGLPSSRVVVADAESPAIQADFVLLDPDRRATESGERTFDPALFSPRLGRALELARAARAGCIKLPPGMSPKNLEIGGSSLADLRFEWVSLRGEMRELCVWTGAAAEHLGTGRAAVVLDDRRGVEATLAPDAGPLPSEPEALQPEQARHSQILVEPDPAVLRAGLFGQLARELSLAPFSPEIAYLGDPDRDPSDLLETPFAKAFRVLDRCEADPRRVRAMLKAHEIGPLTVKKRGHPQTAATLEKRFRGKGPKRGLLCVTRVGRDRGHLALLLEPISPAG